MQLFNVHLARDAGDHAGCFAEVYCLRLAATDGWCERIDLGADGSLYRWALRPYYDAALFTRSPLRDRRFRLPVEGLYQVHSWMQLKNQYRQVLFCLDTAGQIEIVADTLQGAHIDDLHDAARAWFARRKIRQAVRRSKEASA